MSASKEELTVALERDLGGGRRVERLERRPGKYVTSFPLEDVDVTLDDGSTLALVFKDLNPAGLPDNARAAKPDFLLDPERELEAYGGLLQGASLGTPSCHALVRDPERGRYWLLLERVDGVPLWQVGEMETWQAAARWLAGLHTLFAAGAVWRTGARHLVRYDADLYRRWAERARAQASAAGQRRRDRERIAHVVERYERTIERLAALPTTFLHGEFYGSNIIVGRSSAGGRTGSQEVRIAPIDWELAAEGPAFIDLAALSTGRWSQEEREAIMSAYEQALPEPRSSHDDFLETVDLCRLHLAVQWLGWAPGWKPPRAHRHDWLREATELVERLKL